MFSDLASLKRFLVFLFGAIFVVAQPLMTKYGVPTPDDAQLAVFAGFLAAYIAQSAAKSISVAKTAGTVAAAAVTSTAQADAVIATAVTAQKAIAARPLPTIVTLMPPTDNDVTPAHGNVTP